MAMSSLVLKEDIKPGIRDALGLIQNMDPGPVGEDSLDPAPIISAKLDEVADKIAETVAEKVITHIIENADFTFSTVLGGSVDSFLVTGGTVLPGIATVGSPAAQTSATPGTAIVTSVDMAGFSQEGDPATPWIK